MQEKSHLKSLDFLRGIAALAVCFAHFTNGNRTYLPNNNPLKIAGGYGSYGVHIFFIVSGIVIPYAMDKAGYKLKNFRNFMLKRITRIEPPYLISICVILLLNYLSSFSPYYHGTTHKHDIVNILLHIGYINIFLPDPNWLNPVYWTLAIEFQYYVLIALIFPLIRSAKAYKWFSALLMFNLISFVVINENFIFHYSFYFTLGIMSYKYITQSVTLKIYLLSVLLLSGIIFFKFSLPGLIAGLVPVLFLFVTVDFPVTRFLGKISYSLYLMHGPVGLRIINLSENFIKNINQRIIIIFSSVLITMFICYVFCIYVEIPFKKMAKKIQYYNTEKKFPVVMV